MLSTTPDACLSELVSLLRCLECKSALEVSELVPGGYPELGPDGLLSCPACSESYPVIGGTARMLPAPLRATLREHYPLAHTVSQGDEKGGQQPDFDLAVKQQTAESFAYEWEQFGDLRAEWRKNFLDYMQPHPASSFDGSLVLDVGTGSGRHSHQAAELGARVVAVDIGRSIDTARRNLPREVLTVQADAEQLPLARDAFDFVMSIGVLHHLPDTERALRSIVPYTRPGGHLQIYLYWQPEQRWQRWILRWVSRIRRITVRMPHRLLHAACYPLSVILFFAFVLPHRILRRVPGGERLSGALPLKTYAEYPFGVLVNDQFDRFSAPIERRFTPGEVREMLEESGLEEICVTPNHGWLGSARRPADEKGPAGDSASAGAEAPRL